MRNQILILFIFIFAQSNNLLGQQNPQFSQYYFNQLYLNPATAGNEVAAKIQLVHRSQYLGYVSNFDNGGILNSQVLSVQLPVSKSNSGLGLVIVNDQAGLQKNLQMNVAYSKSFKIPQGIVSVGASVGMYNKSFENNFRPREGNDPNIPTGGFNQMKPDVGIGGYLTAKSYFVGLGINHINKPKFDFGADNGKNIINRNFSVIAGLNLPLTAKLVLKPNALFRTDLQTYDIEGGLMALVSNKHWLGLNCRKSDAIILMAGTSILKDNSLKLGGSVDFVTSNKTIKSNTTVEFLASYIIGSYSKNVKVQVKNPVIRTPRYRH